MGGVGLGWGIRVDVNEIEVFVKIQKKTFFFWGGGRWGNQKKSRPMQNSNTKLLHW